MGTSTSYYPRRKLDSISSLAKLLGIRPSNLIKIANNARKYYKTNSPKYKNDGTYRQTYTILQPLKTLLCRIKMRIFGGVEYANFLFGGIKFRNGIKGNAKQLVTKGNPRALLKFDIKNFFPTVTILQVQNIWRHFFNFSEDVSNILSKLVTLNGVLPQGAHTSSDLANLVFWKDEHSLARGLMKRGVVYTRYVDDVCLVVTRSYNKQDLKNLVSLIFGYFSKCGFVLGRKKMDIITSAKPMVINKSIVINNRYNTPIKTKINQANKKLRELSLNIKYIDPNSLKKEIHSLLGFIRHLLFIKNNRRCRKMLEKANDLLNNLP